MKGILLRMFLFSGSKKHFSNSVVPSEDSSSESDNPSIKSPKIFVATDVKEVPEEAGDEWGDTRRETDWRGCFVSRDGPQACANRCRAKDEEAFVSFELFIPGFQNISKDTHAVISFISYRWNFGLELEHDSNPLSRYFDLRQVHPPNLLQWEN